MVEVRRIGLVLVAAAAVATAGCTPEATRSIQEILDTAGTLLNATIDNVQETDPRLLEGLPEEIDGLGGIDLDDDVIRLDVLYGVKTLYPELACRIWGAEG